MAKERKFKTEPNQKVIRVNKTKVNKGKTYTIIDNDVLFNAMQELKLNELKLFLYIASNQNGYEFALSTKHVAEVTGANQRELQNSVNSLIEKGYLVCEGGNRYMFYEDKQQSKVCGKTTECYEEIPHSKDTPMRENNIGGCGNSTEGGVEKQHTPMRENHIEILQDNTKIIQYNNTEDCNALLVSKEEKEQEQKQPLANDNYDLLQTSKEDFEKWLKGLIADNNLEDEISTGWINNILLELESKDIDIVKYIYNKYSRTRTMTIAGVFCGVRGYIKDNYDKEVHVYIREKETQLAKEKSEQARINYENGDEDYEYDEILGTYYNKTDTDKVIEITKLREEKVKQLQYQENYYNSIMPKREKKEEVVEEVKPIKVTRENYALMELMGDDLSNVIIVEDEEIEKVDTPQTIDTGIQNETVATESVEFELVYEEEELNDYDNFSYYDEEDRPLSEIEKMFT